MRTAIILLGIVAIAMLVSAAPMDGEKIKTNNM